MLWLALGACSDDATQIGGAASCEGQTCSDRGECVQEAGGARCVCEAGYMADGLTCVSDDDADLCVGVLCSGRGECQAIDGQAQCVCDDGYTADGLDCVPYVVPGETLVELSVTEPAGVSRSQAAIRGGVPFPQGMLQPTDTLGLYDAETEAQLPLQTRILSVWPDGSVRWLLVDTQSDLPGQTTRRVALRRTETTAEIGTPLEVSEVGDTIQITSGNLSVEVPTNYGGLIHRASLDGQELIAPPTDARDRGPYVTTSGTTYFGALLTDAASPSAGDPILTFLAYNGQGGMPAAEYHLRDPWQLDVLIEEQGPLRSVVRVSGAHLDEGGESSSFFVTRLHFLRGKTDIEVEHTWIFTGEGNNDQIAGYGVKLPFTPTASLVEGESGEGSVLHSAFDGYTVAGTSQPGQALGYAAQANGDARIAVFLSDMAENFPKAIRASAEGLDVQLYPDAVTPWNIARYSSSLDAGSAPNGGGETSATANRGSQGIAKTDRFVLSFASDVLDRDTLAEQATADDDGRLWLMATPKWYSDARVMGYGSFAFDTTLTDNEVHYRVDKVMQLAEQWMRFNQRERFGWYGIEDYGDIRGWFLGGANSAEWFERGRYGWSGNSGEPSNQLWLQCLRNQSQACLRDAAALTRHTYDLAMVHFGTAADDLGGAGRNAPQTVGTFHRHGLQPWSGYAGFPEYTHVAGLETLYYLTGDGRAREALFEAAQSIYRYGVQFTNDVNGIDVQSRAAAVFYDTPHGDRFAAQIDEQLVALGAPGVIAGNLPNQSSLNFIRMLPGLMYHHERTGDGGDAVFTAADVVVQNAGSWGIDTDPTEGSLRIHMPIVSYAADVAEAAGRNAEPYRALTQRLLENNCLSQSTSDSDEIPLSHWQAMSDDWRSWDFEWVTGATPPSLLWIARQAAYRNDDMMGYHFYRIFPALAAAAATIAPDTAGLTAR